MNEQIPEYFADVYHLRNSVWGVALTLSVSSPKEGVEVRDICTIRFSHETAKTLSMLIRKQLKKYERDTSTKIAVPINLLNELGLAPEDW
jgi:hypothetical protein